MFSNDIVFIHITSVTFQLKLLSVKFLVIVNSLKHSILYDTTDYRTQVPETTESDTVEPRDLSRGFVQCFHVA